MSRPASPPSSWRDIEVAAGGEATSSLASLIIDGASHGGARSVCVLDTNTVLHALPLLTSLFALLLETAHHSFLYTAAPPPMTILIPHHVLEELDNLKLRKSSIRHKARSAARWILGCVKTSHRSRTDAMEYTSSTLPLIRRPIIVQTATQASQLERSARTLKTVDEVLCELCAQLEKQTNIPVMFCSNDVIARTRAEAQGVKTFDLEAILEFVARRRTAILDCRNGNMSRHDPARQQHTQQAYKDADEAATKEAAAALLEQWADQIHNPQQGDVHIHAQHTQQDSDLNMVPIEEDRPVQSVSAPVQEHTATELNPHIDWHTLSASSSPAQSLSHSHSPPRRARQRSNTNSSTRTNKTDPPTERYLSYYERKQIELRQKEMQARADGSTAMMMLDEDG